MSKQVLSLESRVVSEVPHGELVDTLKSLEKISPIEIDSLSFKQKLDDYANKHLILYSSGSESSKGAPQGENPQCRCFLREQKQGEGYLDQQTGEIFQVDQITNMIIGNVADQKSQLPQPLLHQLKALKQGVQSYMKLYYSEAYASTCHFETDSGQVSRIRIGLTSKQVNPGNMKSSEWVSVWSVCSDQIRGQIYVKNHFYEGGNISMQRTKSVSQTHKDGNGTMNLSQLSNKQIDSIIETISHFEKAYQEELSLILQEQVPKYLKKLRRITSTAQHKMQWNFNGVLLAQGINQSNKEEHS